MARRALPDVVSRSVTLLRAFLILSALILASGAVVLGTVLTAALRGQAVDDAERTLSEHTEAVVGPHLVEDGEVAVNAEAAALLEHEMESRENIVNVKVWRADGTLIWTRLEPERMGTQYPLGGLLKAIETGEADGHLENLHEEEDAAEALGISTLLEVYAPIEADGEVVGALRDLRRRRPARGVERRAPPDLGDHRVHLRPPLARARSSRANRLADALPPDRGPPRTLARSRTPTSGSRRTLSKPWKR